MIIDFEKTIHFHAEIDDDGFKDEEGNINEDLIINFCETVDSPSEENHCWVYDDELKNISYVDSNNKGRRITESDYTHYRLEKERAEHCYECSGYGDDYDPNGNSNCDNCPFNSNNE